VTSQLVGNKDQIAQDVQSAWEQGRNLALASGMAVSQPEIKPQATLAGGNPVGTYGLMGLLVVVYGCEILYQVGGPSGLTPSVKTLAVLGGDMGKLVKDYGEYWRIFTAPLMHANPLHILFNGIALLFAGAALERIAGWKWLLGTFAISAICGEIATLLFVAPNIVGVGASGGIMGILAALLLAAQRLPDNAKRALQTNASSYLIPALLPIFSGGKNINYFAHAGGALAGVALGFVLWKFWRHDHPVPPLANVMAAAALGFIGVAVYARGWPR
jgi:rhomboid protease GluP